MARNPDRVFDKTHLSIDLAEERQLVHRDYIAHCFRWSHTVRYLLKGHRYQGAVILDVGCGKEMPLAKALYTNKMSPGLYVGVDVNKMDIPEMLKGKKIPIRLFSETDFCSLTAEDVGQEFEIPAADPEGTIQATKDYSRPDLVTSFEVLEHVTPAYCRKMLTHMRELMEPKQGAVIVSTPCWNGSAAGNHINEMRYDALGALIEDLGFAIEGHYGTFASISDYEKYLMEDSGLNGTEPPKENVLTAYDAFKLLREYYDTNVLATIFAPLYPQGSRNCLWRMSHTQPEGYVRKFAPLMEIPTPWSQHADWRELGGDEAIAKFPQGDPAPVAQEVPEVDQA
jgi:Methyltransferase domain